MKSAKPSTRTSKRSQGKGSTATPTSGTMTAAEETFVDPTAALDPFGGVDDIDPTISPLLTFCAMMESFMTTQVLGLVPLNPII